MSGNLGGDLWRESPTHGMQMNWTHAMHISSDHKSGADGTRREGEGVGAGGRPPELILLC